MRDGPAVSIVYFEVTQPRNRTQASAKTCWPVSYNTRMSVMSSFTMLGAGVRLKRGSVTRGGVRENEENGMNACIKNGRELGEERIWERMILVIKTVTGNIDKEGRWTKGFLGLHSL